MKALLLIISLISITTHVQANTKTQVAFIPDIHFHDIYGDFSQQGFKGIQLAKDIPPVSIRSMRSQIHSTRLFNENYFALITTLNDIAAKGITLVALPGDFTDDGQLVHLYGLKKILNKYTKEYGMRFFAIPGNHDPVKPFKSAGGKPDFLNEKGQELAIYSTEHLRCTKKVLNNTNINTDNKKVICSDDIAHGGYKEVVEIMAPFGLMPSNNELLWETPFSKGPSLAERSYVQCAENDKSNCINIPDTSYLIEPLAGLWLLAIDANVYIPQVKNGVFDFQGSGNAGYNKVLSEKPFLLTWIKEVVQRAKTQNKTLIAFSHFPMGEFYDGQTESIQALFGNTAFQLKREPTNDTRKLLAETGLRLHIGGHMHMNDTSVIKSKENTLFNIQAPSIAAYRPAYKLVSIENSYATVSTVTIDNVKHFNLLFSAYQKEHKYLLKHDPEHTWNKEILSANNYQNYTKMHLQALAKWRFIPREWPASFRDDVLKRSLFDTLMLTNNLDHCATEDPPCLPSESTSQRLNTKQLHALKNTTVFDFISDFYLVRNAGSLAFADISEETQQIYTTMGTLLKENNSCRSKNLAYSTLNNLCQVTDALARAFVIYEKFSNALPDSCLVIDLSSQAPIQHCAINNTAIKRHSM
ncbi:metallophosphoesterase family protein [Colwellia sp. 1_MG-2023]|uniref:metallophosphoesterase family protein n=1 Tax=unclassified Colwellia TaxID=196834 RepID=UPI001C0922FE|nr:MULTISPECIES: metallophosphoesterase family protein [unclassified Colwellia]MBU2926380.1 metallophosphoesterase [Colwellia sp. C2M11]MDO6651818.1 metallophosphoesterase family protein [Colwellia sp. 3_MG-2023]MDO6665271.1 metallophosphoesterase family protein [Colwellia sp. 2_MG-2023]MDO6689644.1 metallophosphoesterase family protein [Colwellia sp. 1_MG-2023]